MEPKQPISWKLYRQELLVEEIDKESKDLYKGIKEYNARILELLVQVGLEPPSSLLNPSLPLSEDE